MVMSSPDAFLSKTPGVPNPSPFSVEKIDAVSTSLVEFKDEKLFINGVLQTKYSHVNRDHSRRQRSDPNLLHFQATVGDASEEKNFRERVVDINHPEIELAAIGRKGKYEDGLIAVNDQVWDSLKGKNIYSGGYLAEVDPDGKKVVFHTADDRNNVVIINNVEWRTRFDRIHFAASRFGIVYAVGSRKDQEPMLVVDDKEWVYPKFKYSKSFGDQAPRETSGRVDNAIVGKSGQVAVAISSPHAGNAWQEYVLVGDKVGAKEQWKNTLGRIDDIIIDDESGSVAVFGVSDDKKIIIIDDIPFAIGGNPGKLEHFKFQDGGVVIQYTDALGEKVTEKILLRSDAPEIQKKRAEQEAADSALLELRILLAKQGISPTDIASRLKGAEDLDRKTKEIDQLRNALDRASTQNREIQLEIAGLKEQRNAEARQREIDAGVAQRKRADTIGSIETTFKSARKTFGGSHKISTDDMTAILTLLEGMR